jgi:hypothetical protein
VTEKIKVNIDGKDDELTVHSFLQVVESSYGLLKHLSGTGVTWIVGEVSHNSPVSFEFVGTGGGAVSSAVHKFHGGMRALKDRSDPSDYFDERALKLARKLASPLSNGVASVSFDWAGEALAVPKDLELPSIVAEIEPYSAFTELEGVFERFDLHGVQQFSIFDRVTGKQTICDFSGLDISLEELLRNVRKRLRVAGKAKFDSSNHPARIKVASLEPVGPAVSLEELHKAELRLDREMTAEEIIRNLRGMDA